LLLSPPELEGRLRSFFTLVLALPPAQRAAWVCGLGHGVLQQTPEQNVHLALKIQREMFA
jgi:uroporphyrinogen decarboxylase